MSAYVVERTVPFSAHPHLTDETREVVTEEEAGVAFADLSGQDERDSIAAMIEDGHAEWTDPETDVEVTARRV